MMSEKNSIVHITHTGCTRSESNVNFVLTDATQALLYETDAGFLFLKC